MAERVLPLTMNGNATAPELWADAFFAREHRGRVLCFPRCCKPHNKQSNLHKLTLFLQGAQQLFSDVDLHQLVEAKLIIDCTFRRATGIPLSRP